MIAQAAALTTSYANKAIRNLPAATPLRVSVKHNNEEEFVTIVPNRQTVFKESSWDEASKCLKEINRTMTEQRLAAKKEKFYTWVSRKIYKKEQQK